MWKVPLIDADIRHATFVRAHRERVYDLFATAEGLDAWFATGADVDARPGGSMVWRWKDWGPDRVTTVADGQVLEALRPDRFVFHLGLREFKPYDRGNRLRDRRGRHRRPPAGVGLPRHGARTAGAPELRVRLGGGADPREVLRGTRSSLLSSLSHRGRDFYESRSHVYKPRKSRSRETSFSLWLDQAGSDPGAFHPCRVA